jgi:hypothetical protein
MSEKIHNYPIERFVFGADDYYDIDYWDGSSYHTAKIKGSTILAGVTSGMINVYNANGIITSDRTIDTNGFDLSIHTSLGAANGTIFKIDDSTNQLIIGGNETNSPKLDVQGESQHRKLIVTDVNGNTAFIELNQNASTFKLDLELETLTSDHVQTFQNKSGTIALLSDITAGSGNIYSNDGTLTGTRTLSGNNNTLIFQDLGIMAIIITPPTSPPFNEVGLSIQCDTTNLATGKGRPFEVYSTNLGQILFGSCEDGSLNVNNKYYIPNNYGADGTALVSNGLLQQDLAWKPVVTDEFVNHSSTQWSTTPASATTLADGEIANGFTFFTNGNKVASGTTSYNEYDIAFGLTITITGSSGTANININGTNYLATWNTSQHQTAVDFVSTHESALNADNVRVFVLGSGTDGRLRFCSTEAILNGITITTLTGNLNGTIANEFTGDTTAQPDHVLVPYSGEPYDGDRIHHGFRVNFTITPSGGSTQSLALSLRRYKDDSVIASELLVLRTADEGAQQFNFLSYTNGATDPFVEGGFYFALRNDSGGSIEIAAEPVGILIQNTFQKSCKF